MEFLTILMLILAALVLFIVLVIVMILQVAKSIQNTFTALDAAGMPTPWVYEQSSKEETLEISPELWEMLRALECDNCGERTMKNFGRNG